MMFNNAQLRKTKSIEKNKNSDYSKTPNLPNMQFDQKNRVFFKIPISCENNTYRHEIRCKKTIYIDQQSSSSTLIR